MKPRLLSLVLILGIALAAADPNRALGRPASGRQVPDPAPTFMPLNPDIVPTYRAGGRAVPLSTTEARFADRPGVTINRIERAAAATAGTVKAIVLLVTFTDNPPGGPTTRFRPTVWDSMLFGDAYVRGGADTTTMRTLKRFYGAVSYGTVDVVTLNLPSSIGWLAAPNSYAYYCEHDGVHDNGFGPYPRNVQRLVMDAVTAADPFVDFSQYAVGGVVRNLFVVHAGSGAEWSGGADLIWSHAWSIAVNDGFGTTPPPLYVDGVRVTSYSMEPEAGGDTVGEAGAPMTPLLPTVGVYAHEFGHVLGLPDEYDYGYESRGTGRISLMAGGSWNRVPNIYPDCAGNSPAHPSAWGSARLGFVTPTVVTSLTTGITIPPIELTGAGAVYKVVHPGSDGKEYWLFENRQQLGFDEGFARIGSDAHGLCIYHVDENVLARTFWRPNEAECVSGGVYQGQTNCDCASLPANPTNGERWYGISVEQADGLNELELGINGGNWQDFYSSATGVAAFTPGTVPNSTSYYAYNACAGLAAATNIQESGQTITLDLTADVRTYALDVTVAGNGSVGRTPDLAAYQHGSTVTLEATPADGHHFLGWSGDTTSSANPLVLTMYGDKAVTATFAAATGAEEGLVARLDLAPVRPNPIQDRGRIGFDLPRQARARLSVLDLQGREVAVLADGLLPPGRHAVVWDGRTERGAAPAGLYFVRLSAEGRVLSRRLVRLR